MQRSTVVPTPVALQTQSVELSASPAPGEFAIDTGTPFPAIQTSAAPTQIPAWEWKTSSPEAQGMDSRKLAEMLSAMRRDGYPIHSLLIVRHGYLVLEAYFDPFHAAAAQQIYSCTKSVTSALVGIAIEQGLLGEVWQPAWHMLPPVELDDNRKAHITLEHLLSMSPGLEWDEGGIEYRSPNNPYSAVIYVDNPVQYIFDQPLVETPGTRFTYNSGASHLLSIMVSQAAGMSTHEFARRELFAPLGISATTWQRDARDVNLGGSGLTMLPRDMAKFGQLYLQNGTWDGKQVIPPQWVQASVQPYVEARTGVDYGYQWWIPRGKGFLASGWGQQNIWVLPAQDMVVVFTAGMKNDEWLPHGEYLDTFILPSVTGGGALEPDAEGEARLAAEVEAARHPPSQPVEPLPPQAQQIMGKTWLITGSGITLPLDYFTIEGYTGDEMLLHASLLGHDLDLRAGMDGSFRNNVSETGEFALKAHWLYDNVLSLVWQDVSSAEQAVITITFQGDEFIIQTDLYVEGITEVSEGVLLE